MLSLWRLLLVHLLLFSWVQGSPTPKSKPPQEEDGIELEDMSPKELTMHQSCRSGDAKRINTAFSQALDIASSGISTIDWLLIEFGSTSDAAKKRRISHPLRTMAGDNMASHLKVDGKRARIRELQKIFKRVRAKTSQPLFARCDTEFLQDQDPQGETGPACTEEDKSYYWSTITERWVVMDRPKCQDTPVFVYPGNETFPDQLVFCPLGLKLLKERAYIKDLKAKSVSDIAGTFIDVLAVSPPSWVFRGLLQTRQVGQYDNLDLGKGLRAEHWEGVRTLALNKPWEWMKNAGTINYVALAWYMDKWNWESGEAVDPSVKDPKMLPLKYADIKFPGKGKGRALPEVDITDVRILEAEEDPIYPDS